ncbi:MAG: M15 family metallopeptidase [Bdellovibrio sp.]|nr:M15 family metallopeptidase [Bdellovibrio sp.]
MAISFEILTGRTDTHLVHHPGFDIHVHHDALSALTTLQNEAKVAGFDPMIVSAFRSYQQQLKIWNAKAKGERAVLDDQGFPMDITSLSEEELCLSIMRWSALPGASRHHWGTDFDIVDRQALPSPDYQIQLIPKEVESGGIFAPFYDWLEDYLKSMTTPSFFWPFLEDKKGIAPERWHLSYVPTASSLLQAYSFEIFWRNIEESDLLLKQAVKLSAHELYHRFFLNITAMN